MAYTQKIVIGALIGAAIAYLLVAFVQFDINAANWLQDTRLGCALAMILTGWIGAFIAWINGIK